MRKTAVTALAHAESTQFAPATSGAPAPSKSIAQRWRIRAVVDAIVLVTAFAGSWIAVALVAIAIVKVL